MDSSPSEPRPKPTTASAASVPPSAPPLKVRILHVEDNPADVELIRQNLKRGGIDVEVVVVDNLRDCEAMLDKERFDLVISDFNLPRGNGLEVLSAVRKKRPTLPFILISGSLGE